MGNASVTEGKEPPPFKDATFAQECLSCIRALWPDSPNDVRVVALSFSPFVCVCLCVFVCVCVCVFVCVCVCLCCCCGCCC